VNIPELRWRGILLRVQIHPAKVALYLSFFAVAGQDSLDVEVPIQRGDAVGAARRWGIRPVLMHLRDVRLTISQR